MGSMEDAFRKAGVTPAAPEPPPEKACARCGKTFRPARLQHKLCEECVGAVRAERAAETTGKPADSPPKPGPEKPADAASGAAPPHARRGEPERERAPHRERHPPTPAGESAPARVLHAVAPARRPVFPLVHGLPTGYLEGGYFTPAGALRRELLTDWAEQIAQAVAMAPADPTAHQLRAFHNHVKRVVVALKFGKRPIERVLNEIQKLKPFAAERAARRKVPDLFRQFVEANVDRVTDEKTLLAFAEHFQAVAAYAGGLLQTRKERR